MEVRLSKELVIACGNNEVKVFKPTYDGGETV